MMPKRLLPPTQELIKLREQGWTCQQIADWVEETTHVRVSADAVNMALLRAGSVVQPRYPEDIPWRVRQEHSSHHDAQMLRVNARMSRGRAVKPHERRAFDSWKQRLDEAGAVVHYHPDHGFMWVARRPGVDTGLIRVPKKAERPVDSAAAI